MKTTIEINGKSVEIELTAQQIADIKKQSVTYTDIKTFEDACNYEGIDAKAFHEQNKHLPDDVYAYMQLRIISKALNGGEHMNYDDTDECKYYPYFKAVGSSVGFSYDDCRCVTTASNVGSRLVYPSREIAEYVGETHLQLYRDMMVID